MATVLIVARWFFEEDGSVPIIIQSPSKVKVKIVTTSEEAHLSFNGKAEAIILVVSAVSGARELVQSVKARFPHVLVVGLIEHRLELSNIGCRCFVSREQLPLTVPALLQELWRHL